MQIEPKLQVAGAALLLALIALASPVSAQDPSVCLPPASTLPPSTECQDFLASLGDNAPTQCEEGLGVEEVQCVANPADCASDFPAVADCVPAGEPCDEGEVGQDPACVPVAAPPCVPGEDDFVGCALEATTLFACEDLTDAATCEPTVDPTGDLGSTVCTTLDPDSEETDAVACITAALTALVCAQSEGETLQECITALSDRASCEEGSEGTFPDCDGTVAGALAEALSSFAPTADAGTDASVAEGTQDVALDGSGASALPVPAAANELTFAWAQTGGPSVTLVGADTAAPTFDAPALDGLQQVLTFELTVTDTFGSATDSVAVTVTNVATADTSVNAVVQNGAAVLSMQAPADPNYAPSGAGAGLPATYFVKLDTSEGTEGITDSLLTFSVTDPFDADTAETYDSKADSKTLAAQPETDIRTYTFGLTLPNRLADGTYTVASTYDGSEEAGATFTVQNVAPTVAGTPALHNGRSSFPAVATAVQLALDDANWDSYGGAAVTELSSLTFQVTDALDNVVASGFEFDVDGGAFGAVPSLDLAARSDDQAITVPVAVRYDGTVAAGTYTVTAIVTDDDGATDELDFLTVALVPANFGFSMAIDDGSDGVSVGTVSSDNQRYNTAADPLEIQITGTLDAALLKLAVPDLTGANPLNDDVIPANGMKVLVYTDSADVGNPNLADLVGTVAGNALTLDLSGASIGLSESSIFVVFDVQVFDGTNSDSYSTAIDLLSTADE